MASDSLRVLFALCLATTLGCSETSDDSDHVEPRPELDVPAWAWSHWVWEDESTQESALALVEGYLSRDIPVKAIIIDSPWATGYNTFEWDLALYPEPKSMIDALHAQDVRVLLWVVPVINVDVEPLYSEAASKGYFMQRGRDSGPGVFEWWKGEGSLIDLWNPEALAWWHSLIDPVLDQGIDGWKCDGAEYNAFLAGVDYSPALGRRPTHLEYSTLYTDDFYEYTRARLGSDRIITTRPIDNYGLGSGGELFAFSSPETNWAGWVGDQDPTFEGLRAALDNMYYSAEYGYLGFGSDIGGYRGDSRTREVFIRWAQLGAFSPVMENGGSGEHRPWMFDEETTDIYRDLVELHHEILPYLLEEGKRAYAEHRSLLTFFDDSSYRYLLGEDLFVAPILREGTKQTIELPADGRWVWLFGDHSSYQGGETVELDFGLDEYPAYVRAGSALEAQLLPRAE